LISNCPELLPRSNECQLMESECANPDCTCPVCSELYPEESCFLVSGLTGSCEPGEYFWTSTVCESVTGSCPAPSIDYTWQVGYFNGSLKLAGPEETGLVRCVRGLPDWS